jgi:hypothetical protein
LKCHPDRGGRESAIGPDDLRILARNTVILGFGREQVVAKIAQAAHAWTTGHRKNHLPDDAVIVVIATKHVHADVDERKLKASRKPFYLFASKVAINTREDDLARAHDLGDFLPAHGMCLDRPLWVDALHQVLHNLHLLPAAANSGRRCADQAVLMPHPDAAWINKINVTKADVRKLLSDV